jgi:hypothetical protein
LAVRSVSEMASRRADEGVGGCLPVASCDDSGVGALVVCHLEHALGLVDSLTRGTSRQEVGR